MIALAIQLTHVDVALVASHAAFVGVDEMKHVDHALLMLCFFRSSTCV